MAENDTNPVTAPTPLQQQAAKGQFGLAERLLLKGNYADAIHLMRDCCRVDPANLGYRRALRNAELQAVKSGAGWLGKAALKTKRKMAKLSHAHMNVLEYGEALLAQDPEDVACQLDMAESAMALDLPIVALWILEHARKRTPCDAINLALAKVYEQIGKFPQAIALLQQVSPNNPNRGELHQKIKDLMANESIRRAFDAKPADPQPALNDTGKMPSAVETATEHPVAPAVPARQTREVEAFRGRITADPSNVNVYLPLVAYLRRAGDLKQCAEVLREALAATSNHPELSLELADLEIEHKRRGLADVDARIKANPDDASLVGARTALHQVITSGELKYYRQKVKLLPADLGARFELAVRLYRAGQFQDAVQELQGTRETPRYQWQSLAYLGLSFEKMKVWRLAQRNLKEALQKMPAEEVDWRKRVLFHLAQGAAGAGEIDEAIEMGYELANLDFTYRKIDKLLAEWQAARGGEPEA
jgi:tetratricopeptide (TPR) repeat protein